MALVAPPPSAVGVEALVGLVGEMTGDGWVRVNGELWRRVAARRASACGCARWTA